MKELVVNYLLQYQNCPLPAVGTLQILRQPATVIQGEKLIISPKYRIELNPIEISAAGFIKFIAATSHQNEELALENLESFCASLMLLKAEEKLALPMVGAFSVDIDGRLAFSENSLKESFSPTVHAERVIHENDIHQILVGDTETTNREMSDFYNDSTPGRTNRWWIWAIVLFVAAAVAILLFTTDAGRQSIFGNGIKVNPHEAPATYTTGN